MLDLERIKRLIWEQVPGVDITTFKAGYLEDDGHITREFQLSAIVVMLDGKRQKFGVQHQWHKLGVRYEQAGYWRMAEERFAAEFRQSVMEAARMNGGG